jgi:hypothetical protein
MDSATSGVPSTVAKWKIDPVEAAALCRIAGRYATEATRQREIA